MCVHALAVQGFFLLPCGFWESDLVAGPEHECSVYRHRGMLSLGQGLEELNPSSNQKFGQ